MIWPAFFVLARESELAYEWAFEAAERDHSLNTNKKALISTNRFWCSNRKQVSFNTNYGRAHHHSTISRSVSKKGYSVALYLLLFCAVLISVYNLQSSGSCGGHLVASTLNAVQRMSMSVNMITLWLEVSLPALALRLGLLMKYLLTHHFGRWYCWVRVGITIKWKSRYLCSAPWARNC